MLGLLLATLFFLFLSNYFVKSWRYWKLPSPGPCLPVLGHAYEVMTEAARKDPVNTIWSLYKKHSVKGMMWLRVFNFDNVYVGDFDTLKYIFNHPDVQVYRL